MQAVICDQLKGSWPDWEKFRKYGITRVYVDAREATKALIAGIKEQHFEAGIYRDPTWSTDTTAVKLAKDANADLIRILDHPTDQCAVIFDVEFTHNPQYILDLLTAWRKPRPTRETAWTMEPHQGGWFSPALVNRINSDSFLKVMPQTYLDYLGNSMYPASHDVVREDLIMAGVLDSKIELVYDGINGAPAWFTGAVFTDQRLPA